MRSFKDTISSAGIFLSCDSALALLVAGISTTELLAEQSLMEADFGCSLTAQLLVAVYMIELEYNADDVF